MSEPSTYKKPLPQILPETAGFWEAAKRHELAIQQCVSCGEKIFFPRLVCPHCFSSDTKWTSASGRGEVYTFTIIHRPLYDSFAEDVPYVYAIIELEEGVRMISNVINIPPEKVKIGLKVKAIFDDVTPEISLPKFEPA